MKCPNQLTWLTQAPKSSGHVKMAETELKRAVGRGFTIFIAFNSNSNTLPDTFTAQPVSMPITLVRKLVTCSTRLARHPKMSRFSVGMVPFALKMDMTPSIRADRSGNWKPSEPVRLVTVFVRAVPTLSTTEPIASNASLSMANGSKTAVSLAFAGLFCPNRLAKKLANGSSAGVSVIDTAVVVTTTIGAGVVAAAPPPNRLPNQSLMPSKKPGAGVVVVVVGATVVVVVGTGTGVVVVVVVVVGVSWLPPNRSPNQLPIPSKKPTGAGVVVVGAAVVVVVVVVVVVGAGVVVVVEVVVVVVVVGAGVVVVESPPRPNMPPNQFPIPSKNPTSVLLSGSSLVAVVVVFGAAAVVVVGAAVVVVVVGAGVVVVVVVVVGAGVVVVVVVVGAAVVVVVVVSWLPPNKPPNQLPTPSKKLGAGVVTVSSATTAACIMVE